MLEGTDDEIILLRNNDVHTDDDHDDNDDVGDDVTKRTSSSADRVITPLPYKKIAALCFIMLCDYVNAGAIYPYVIFMVKTFDLTDDDKKLGYVLFVLLLLLFLLFMLLMCVL